MKAPSNIDDGQLVTQVLAKNPGAFEELVYRHLPAVSAVALAYTNNRSDAEDVVQESFIKAWNSLDALRVPAKFGGWVVTIARNAARNLQNKRKRELEKNARYQQEMERAQMATGEGDRDEARKLLPALIANLPETDRELILLKYEGGKKSKEIAALMDMSDAAVRKRIQRIRTDLGETLLATLEPDDTRSPADRKRAARIASAAAAVPPTWFDSPTSADGSGIFTSTKAQAFGLAVVVLIAVGIWIGEGDEQSIETAPESSAVSVEIAAVTGTTPPSESVTPLSEDTASESAGNNDPVSGHPSVQGRFYEEDTLNPIAGAEMKLFFSESRTGFETVTDDTGHYEFTGVETGRASLYAGGDDFRDWYPLSRNKDVKKIIHLNTGDTLEGIDFSVVRGLTVAGIVLSPNGQPLPGADMIAKTNPDAIPAHSKTDDSGRFLLNGFATDRGGLFWPRYPGYAMVRHGPVKIPPEGIKNLVLKMAHESTIAGRIIDHEGTPMNGVKVLQWPRGFTHFNDNYGTTTDDEGKFVLSGLHQSSYRIRIRLPDDRSSHRLANIDEIVVGENEHITGVEWIYHSPGEFTITGRVTDDVGKPIRGQIVRADRSGIHRSAESDKDGYYTLKNLSNESYSVELEFGAGRIAANGGDRDVDFVIKRKGTVRGNVVDAETLEPIKNFELMNPTYIMNWYNRSHPEGAFEMKYLFPGKKNITVRAPGYAMGRSEQFVLSPGEVREGILVELDKAGTIAGRVTDQEGDPVRDATIGSYNSAFHDLPRTDAKGEFVFADAKPGANVVGISHPDYAPVQLDVQVIAGETSEIEVTLRPGAVLSGYLYLKGEPIDGEDIQLTSNESGSKRYQMQSVTGHDGRFEFTGLPEGEVTLRANPIFRAQGQTVDIPVTIPKSTSVTQDIELFSGDASVKFTVEMDDELRAYDGRIRITIDYQFENGEKESFYASSVPFAGQTFTEIRPGTATLEAKYTPMGTHEPVATVGPKEIMILDGIENEITLDFNSDE